MRTMWPPFFWRNMPGGSNSWKKSEDERGVALHHFIEFFVGLPAKRTAEGLVERFECHAGPHAVPGSQGFSQVSEVRSDQQRPISILLMQRGF